MSRSSWMSSGGFIIFIIVIISAYQVSAQNDCREKGCQNSGTCREFPDNNADCYCPPEFYGTFCEFMNPCILNNLCGDRGNCSNVRASQWECDCTAGYWGYKCDNLDICASNPCPADRECKNVAPSSFECICIGGGTECKNPCYTSPCMNGGQCTPAVDESGTSTEDFVCECNPDDVTTGYYGYKCEHYDPCLLEPCDKRGGICRNTSSVDYVCNCNPGFYGNSCANFDECLTSPCLNDATCLSSNDGSQLTCHCAPGFQGPFCESLVQCLADTTVDIKGIIQWPTIDVFQNVSNPCPNGGPAVMRECYYNEDEAVAKWTFPNTSRCEKANLTTDVAATMTSYLRDSTGSHGSGMGEAEVSSASELLDAVVLYSYEQHEMANDMMECVSNLLEVDEETLETSAHQSGSDTRLLNLLKNYASNVVLRPEETGVNFVTSNLQFKVQEIDPSHLESPKPMVYSTAFSNVSEKAVVISLPKSMLSDERFADTHNLRMRFTALKNSKLFIERDSKQTGEIDADSQYIISAEVTGYRVADLSVPIEYHVPTPEDGKNYTCAYWNIEEKRWSTHGLSLLASNPNTTFCTSNHLTYFAVILDTGYSQPVPKEHQLPLTILTYLGTACSVLGLVVTIVTYSIFKLLRRTSSGKILIHLCTSLLALNVAFLVNTVPAVTRNRIGCKTTAMLLHYCVLTTFLWMGMEAVNMYRTLVQVFAKQSSSHFILKGAIAAWGLPALPVVITAIIDIDLYRQLPYNDICMLSKSNPYFYYGGYLGPCCTLLLFNSIVFCLILRTVCATKKNLNSTSGSRVRRTHIGCALSVTFLLGITWILGFFAIEDTTLVFTYLVCIVNPLQGFFIFLFRCALYPEVIRSWTVCCTLRTINIERQQRSSSLALGNKNNGSSDDKRRGTRQTDSDQLLSRDSRSSSKKSLLKASEVIRHPQKSASSPTCVQFFGGLKHEGCNTNGNNGSKRKIGDVKYANVTVKIPEESMNC